MLCYVAPSSCLVTEWGEWDTCSATCGLGMKRRERMVKMPPSDGSICGAEVVEVEKCMMPECRKLNRFVDQISYVKVYIIISFNSNESKERN